MLQAGPEIHCYGTDLDLHLGLHRPIRQINRDRHYHMVALVSVRLRVFNVVLDMQDRDIRLSCDHIRDRINVGHKGTDDPDSRDII